MRPTNTQVSPSNGQCTFSPLFRFVRDQEGAVTVDWVVLTGAIMLMAMAVVPMISDGIMLQAERINYELSTAPK
jgi:Flp pilus assembly pilin Flp